MSEFTEMKCGKCGIIFHVPTHFYDDQRKQGTEGGWYCPNGHLRCFRESDADKLRRERDRLIQDLAYKDDRIRDAERATTALKRQITKLKNRASKGVCPCCNRSFENLRRHMDTKHPDFTSEKPELKIVA